MNLIRRLFPRRGPVMPSGFEELAQYNAEVSRGLVHTPEHKERMVVLQECFDEWARQAYVHGGEAA